MKSKFRILSAMFLSVFIVFFALGNIWIKSANAIESYSPGDVLINEFRLDGTQWVELINTTDREINLSATAWELVATVQGPPLSSPTTTLSSIIPARGLITFIPNTIPSSGTPTLLSLKNADTTIYSVSYGTPAFGAEPHFVGFPGASESIVLSGGSWSATTTITRGWYNEAPAPTIAEIVSIINSAGVVTNMGSLTNPTTATGLYFEKRTTLGDANTALGKLTFAGPLNLTNASTTEIIQNLGTKMESAAGSMKFDARTATDLKDAGASVSIYKINDIGYDVANLSISSMTVKDDDGNILSGGSLPDFSSISTSTGNGGTFTFTTSHFTEFGFDPILGEVTPVSTPTASTSPSYTFSSNVVGTSVFGGACSGTASGSTIIGNNTVAFGPLTPATYSNCTVKVIDGAGASTTLAITPFTVTEITSGPATVDLGTSGNFAILSKSGISATGVTSITGDIGVSPITATAVTGFDLSMDSSGTFSNSSLVTGKVYASNYTSPTPSTLTTAVGSMETAYTDAAGRTSPTETELGAGNIGGMTLAPGLYKWTTGVTIPTDLTLSGTSTTIWIFQVDGTLNISSGKKIILSGGALAKNVFWQVTGAVTLGTDSTFNGNILAQTNIAIQNGAILNGRALAQTAVTLDANTITTPSPSSAKAITAFGFASPAVAGVINEGAHTIAVTVPYGTNVTSLVATFTTNGNRLIAGAAIPQTSGSTHNDFTNPFTYTVIANDNSSQSYVVTVTVAANTAKAITSFTITGQVGTTTINETTHSISLTVPFGTNVTALVPTISTSTGATTTPASGAAHDFTATSTYTVTAADFSTQAYVVTVVILSNTQTAPDSNGDATVNNTTPEVVVNDPDQAIDITVSSGTTDPTIDLSSLISGGTGTIPQITITSANAGNATVAIPATTTVTSADTGWNGVLAAPTVTTVTLPTESGQTKTLSTAVEVGFTGAKLSFNKGVRLLLVGQAGKRAGYIRTGISFTEITSTCAADNQATGDALSADGDCKINASNGTDLVIWTKHFTSFATYTQTTNTTTTNYGGGGIAGSGATSIGYVRTYPAVVYTSTSLNTPSEIQAEISRLTDILNVLRSMAGESGTYNFAINLMLGSRGIDVNNLQKILNSDSDTTVVLVGPGSKGNETSFFGPSTRAAVIKFQKKYGISPAIGYVWPITRAKLSKIVIK